MVKGFIHLLYTLMCITYGLLFTQKYKKKIIKIVIISAGLLTMASFGLLLLRLRKLSIIVFIVSIVVFCLIVFLYDKYAVEEKKTWC